MVLPSELLSTVSAGQVRKALVRHMDGLRIELSHETPSLTSFKMFLSSAERIP